MSELDSIRSGDLSVQQLRTFCQVFRRQSYAAAARDLNLAVPTAWEQVKALEQRYGATLFNRCGRRIEPTRVAERLIASLEPLLAGLESTFDLVREEAGEQQMSVTVVTGVRMMIEELGAPFATFREQYPQVRLRLINADNRTAQEEVLEGKADLALMLEPSPDFAKPGLTYQRAYTIDYLAVMPRGHRLAKRKQLSLSDLVREPLVVGHSETVGRRLLEQTLHRIGVLDQLQVAVETDNSAVTAACVRAGMGIGILAGGELGTLVGQLAVRSLKNELGQARIVFVWKAGRQLTTVLQSLVDAVRDACRQE